MAGNNHTAISTLEPKLYDAANGKTWFTVVVEGLEEMLLTDRKDDRDDLQFLDLGCGPGDLTLGGLLPLCLPCRRLVAVDVSRDMVEYAKTHYGHPQITYDVLDAVGDDVADFVGRYGRFDRVYSFYLFNWVKDQEKAFRNLAELMKPGAECLLWFFAASPHIRFRQELAKTERWKRYAEIIEKCVPPTIDMNGQDEIVAYIFNLLKTVNLRPSTCKVSREAPVRYGSPDPLIQEFMGMNPLTTLLSDEEKSNLWKEATKQAARLWTDQETTGSPIEFDVVVVRASKPE